MESMLFRFFSLPARSVWSKSSSSSTERPKSIYTRRKAIWPIFLIVMSLSNSSALFGAHGHSKDTAAAKESSVANRVQAISDLVSKAVVRVEKGSNAATTGIIISEDGHVVWPGSAHPTADLSVVLASGESVPAANLGWSTEWDVGLLKLNGDRKWPHVEFGSTADVKFGDPCFEIGYRATEGKEGQFDRLPATRSGKLTVISPGHWFATDLAPTTKFEYGAGIFDASGRLLGITVPGINTEEHVSTSVDVVRAHWDDLANGKNLDWVRYPPGNDSAFRRISKPESLDRTGFLPTNEVPLWNAITKPAEIDEKAFQAARKIAAATTVRIRFPAGAREGNRQSHWSGTIISSKGLIATCAHCRQLPGEKLIVVLRDSREVSAIVLGTNWVSDIGVVKITEQGRWEFAELGDSSSISPDGAVLCSGFPVPHVMPLPPLTTAVSPLQQTPYVGWSHELTVKPTLEMSGGTSGGGVFSPDGKLVAIHMGYGAGHRIEMFRAQFDYLTREKAMDQNAAGE
jgi:S1-C subfamily serine protease